MSEPSAALRRLLLRPGVQAPSAEGIDEVVRRGTWVLFFTGDATRHPEVDDVAAVLPELARAFDGGFGVAVVDPDVDREAVLRWDAGVRPTLVFVRDGVRLGSIERMRDWSVYLNEIAALLGAAEDANS